MHTLKNIFAGIVAGLAAAALLVGLAGVVHARIYNPIQDTTGVTSLNGLTGATQTFATSTTAQNGDAAIISNGTTHTFYWPTASASVRGFLSSADWTTFNNKAGFAYPFTNGSGYFATTTGGVFNASTTVQVLNADTLDTGQGANELFDMDQNVLTTSNVTFVGLTFTNATGSSLTVLASSTVQELRTTNATVSGSVAVPYAASPTVDGAGEIAVDATTGQLLFYGNAVNVLSASTTKGFTVASTTLLSGTTTIPLIPFAKDSTIISFSCKVVGGTSANAQASDGTNHLDMLPCTTTWSNDTSLSNNTFTTDENFEVRIGTTVGSPNYIVIRYVFTEDRK